MLNAWVHKLWHINPRLDWIRLNLREVLRDCLEINEYIKTCLKFCLLKSIETKMTNLVSDLCILLYVRL